MSGAPLGRGPASINRLLPIGHSVASSSSQARYLVRAETASRGGVPEACRGAGICAWAARRGRIRARSRRDDVEGRRA